MKKMIFVVVSLLVLTTAGARGDYIPLYEPRTFYVPQQFDSIRAVMKMYWPPIEGITIVLGEGTFDEFIFVPSLYTVNLQGQGPGKTILTNSGPEPQVLYASWFDREPPVIKVNKEDWNPPWISEEEIWGSSGGWEVRLENLTVYNPPGKYCNDDCKNYSDGALFCELCGVKLRNVEIVSETNACLMTNYEHILRADHCLFVTGETVDFAVSSTNEKYVDFTNSIIAGGEKAFRCLYGRCGYYNDDETEYIWTDVPSVRMTNCCFLGQSSAPPTVCLDNPNWVLDTSTFINDPQFLPPRYFLPSSPCLGAADDGGNVGTYEPVITNPAAGDMNGDGKVDAIDIQWAVNANLGRNIPELFGDVDGDGKCDAVDIQRTIMAVLRGM